MKKPVSGGGQAPTDKENRRDRDRTTMKRKLTGGTALAVALLGTVGTAIPAGAPEPFQVRVVTMNGTSGPAYYSHATRSYRFVVGAPESEVVAMVPGTGVSESARAQ